jgi:hypothetical protein
MSKLSLLLGFESQSNFMAKRFIWGLSFVVYALLGLAGWAYFGSGEWAQSLRSTQVYKDYVKQPVERLLGSSGGEGEWSGRILRIEKPGEIRYKPSDSFSFFPADPDQNFYGKNVVSTGPGAEIVLLIGEQNYELTLQENTTVVIDPGTRLGESEERAPLKVEVLGGRVKARVSELAAPSKEGIAALQILNVESGQTQELNPLQDSQMSVESQPMRPAIVVPPSREIPSQLQSQSEPESKTQPQSKTQSKPMFQEALTPVTSSPSVVPLPTPENIPFEESLEGFNKTVEASMNLVLESEIKEPRCGQTRPMLEELRRSYPSSDRLQAWLTKWNERILKAKCP